LDSISSLELNQTLLIITFFFAISAFVGEGIDTLRRSYVPMPFNHVIYGETRNKEYLPRGSRVRLGLGWLPIIGKREEEYIRDTIYSRQGKYLTNELLDKNNIEISRGMKADLSIKELFYLFTGEIKEKQASHVSSLEKQYMASENLKLTMYIITVIYVLWFNHRLIGDSIVIEMSEILLITIVNVTTLVIYYSDIRPWVKKEVEYKEATGCTRYIDHVIGLTITVIVNFVLVRLTQADIVGAIVLAIINIVTIMVVFVVFNSLRITFFDASAENYIDAVITEYYRLNS
jgi:hypothetical protein